MHNVVRYLINLTMVFMVLFVTTVSAELPDIPKGNGDNCVAPVDQMRRQHMDMLNHQRDLTVIDGVRTKQFSLKGCIDCHVQQDSKNKFIPVNAPGQFCQSCHGYASVKIDCFECHRTTPDTDQMSDAASGGKPFAHQSDALVADIQRFLARPPSNFPLID